MDRGRECTLCGEACPFELRGNNGCILHGLRKLFSNSFSKCVVVIRRIIQSYSWKFVYGGKARRAECVKNREIKKEKDHIWRMNS